MSKELGYPVTHEGPSIEEAEGTATVSDDKEEAVDKEDHLEAVDEDDEDLSSITELLQSRMDSVSRVAIRNIKPPQVDTNDPDQKRLIEHLKAPAAKIWSYSDNKPAFLAKLNKNNPQGRRKAIETIVRGRPTTDNVIQGGNTASGGDAKKDKDHSKPLVMHSDEIVVQKMMYERSPAARMSSSTAAEDQQQTTASINYVPPGQTEMKTVIKKTVELVADMNKSVELVFHAIRATARFLTYPTPSVPSDNYVFGHIRGWMWLISCGLTHLKLDLAWDQSERVHVINKQMSVLATEASNLAQSFNTFNKELQGLQDCVRKEAKILRGQSPLWAMRMDNYLRYEEEIQKAHKLLLNIKEDRPFASDWAFHPRPSQAQFLNNFFHFQWVKKKRDWDSVEFEVRSDYSTRWHPFSTFQPDQQVEIVMKMVDHVTAILEEANNFIKINMRLSFDVDEVKCLRFAVTQINLSSKKNQRTSQFIGDITRKLFEDTALLAEIAKEFQDQMDLFVDLMKPCYKSLRVSFYSPVKTSPKLPPLDFHLDPTGKAEGLVGCCKCLGHSTISFIQAFGSPMKAVFLRTPISDKTAQRFFDREHLVYDSPPEHGVTLYGVSSGYISSLFDHEMGRDPPNKIPRRLPKVRRKQRLQSGFNITHLLDLANSAIREKDNEVDMEVYLHIFEEIRKFMEVFGSTFNFILSELTERLENLENRLYTQLPDHYETLEKMVEHELTKGVIESNPVTCGTRAFRRVNMALFFFTLFLKNLVTLEDYEGTTNACKTAYYKSFAKYHSWFIQKTSMFSIYSMPNKKMFYAKVIPEMDISDIDKSFEEVEQRLLSVYEHCEKVFKQRDISDL